MVTLRLGAISMVLATASLLTAAGDYASAKRKIDSIEADRLPSGARVVLTFPELSAWAAHEAPAGVRNLRLHATREGLVTGAASIDFGKLERSAGRQPGWLMSKLLDGERPVAVTVRMHSSAGHATVDVRSVEVSGITIDGRTLEFLIQNFLIPQYPDAAISRPFDLGHRIDRLDISATSVTIRIR
jgi:hypothetical protein